MKQPTPKVSLRLDQILRTYCHGLRAAPLADLRGSIEHGHYTWFRDELAAAIQDAAFTPQRWYDCVGDAESSDSAAAAECVREQQCLVWTTVFPGEPVPVHRATVRRVRNTAQGQGASTRNSNGTKLPPAAG